jgi:hypothetical protein
MCTAADFVVGSVCYVASFPAYLRATLYVYYNTGLMSKGLEDYVSYRCLMYLLRIIE